MKCTDCKPCKYSKMIIKNVDDHLTVYAFFCDKYGIYGDTFKELNQNVREEEEDIKMELNQIIEAIKAQDGRNVETVVTTVARSNLSRRIKFFCEGQEITNFFKGSKNENGLFVSGGGADMPMMALYSFYMDQGMKSKEALDLANHYQRRF